MHEAKLLFWSLVVLAAIVFGTDFYRMTVLKQCVYCKVEGASHE